jgi:hypothetical protein
MVGEAAKHFLLTATTEGIVNEHRSSHHLFCSTLRNEELSPVLFTINYAVILVSNVSSRVHGTELPLYALMQRF